MSSPTPGGSSNYDMKQAEETWVNFNRLAKWTIILTIVILAGMALFLTGTHPAKM